MSFYIYFMKICLIDNIKLYLVYGKGNIIRNRWVPKCYEGMSNVISKILDFGAIGMSYYR